MPNGPLGKRSWWLYTSDTGKSYNFRMRDADASVIGNSASTRNANPEKPRSLKARYVWGVTSDGTMRRKFHIGDVSNPIFVNGGTISVDGLSFEITGRVGERDFGSVAG